MKKAILLLAMIISLVGCANSKSNKGNDGEKPTSTPTENISSSVAPNLNKVKEIQKPTSSPSIVKDKSTQISQKLEMTGNISNIPIHMTLNINGNEIKGSYFYDKYRRNIDLAGHISGGKIDLKRVNSTDVEHFSGAIDNNSNIKGTWNNKKYKLNFTCNKNLINNFEIKEIKKDGVDIRYPFLIDKTTLNDKINSRIYSYLAEQIASAKEQNDQVSKDSNQKTTFTFTLDYNIYQCSNYLSVVFVGTYFMDMAAHPSNMCLPINFDLSTGKEIKFSDVFHIDDETIKTLKEISSDNQNLTAPEANTGDCSKDNLFTAENFKESDVYFNDDKIWFTLPVAHVFGDYALYSIDIKYLK